MPEIAPNPDTPLVNAYAYNFGKRVRQPGGRKLQTCLPSKGTQGKPACQCYVFNNWGRPDTLTLVFDGFDNCSHQCGTLLDSHSPPGMGPFTVDFVDELDQHFDTTTGEWIGGGLEVISGAPSNGNGLSSGLGYSCVWQKTGVGDVIDACAGSGPITATCQIGWDTVAGVFCQIQLTGSVLYYSWTWTHLPVTPGTLDCSGNAPEASRLAYLLTANTQGEAEYALGVHNPTGSPNTFWYEFQAENDGQSCFMFNADGRSKLNYSRLCQGCCPNSQVACSQPNASAAVVCCPAGKDGPCGTNEVAPPCCCGDTSGDAPPNPCACIWLCLENTDNQSNCSASIELCRDPTSSALEWSGEGTTLDGNTAISATFSRDGGQWTLTLSCADPIQFPKFPALGDGSVAPVGGNPISASGCCGSGEWNVSLSCGPQGCHYHPQPICQCFDSPPMEYKVTLPGFAANTAEIVCPCPDCGEYAGDYIVQFAGAKPIHYSKVGGKNSQGYSQCLNGYNYYSAWIPGHCGKPDLPNSDICGWLPCKYSWLNSASCPTCTPQLVNCVSPVAPGATQWICEDGRQRPCFASFSLLELWIGCCPGSAFGALVRLTTFLSQCMPDGSCGDESNGGYCAQAWYDWSTPNPVPLDLSKPCCPQFAAGGIPFTAYMDQPGCATTYNVCQVEDSSVSIEAICE